MHDFLDMLISFKWWHLKCISTPSYALTKYYWLGETNTFLKVTVENMRGSVEKLSHMESVKGADTVLRGSSRGSVRFCSRGFARGKSWGSPHTAPQHSVGTRGTIRRRQLYHSSLKIFNSFSDYQFHDIYWQIKLVPKLYYSTGWPLTLYYSTVWGAHTKVQCESLVVSSSH